MKKEVTKKAVVKMIKKSEAKDIKQDKKMMGNAVLKANMKKGKKDCM